MQLHLLVRKSGLPNYRGCRIPVPSELCIDIWHKLLIDYDDKQVCEFLQFGFPLDYTGDITSSQPPYKNHRGAREFPTFLNNYFLTECR